MSNKGSLLVVKEDIPDSQGLGRHVGLVHDRVGGDDPEGPEEQDQEVL